MAIQTLEELEILFYKVLMRLLGCDPNATFTRPPVRRSWPVSGQPDWRIGDDVIFMQLTDAAGDDVVMPFDEAWEDAGEDLIRKDTGTRVLQLQLIAYGPHCYDRLIHIRHGLLCGVDALRKACVMVIPGTDTPQYAPEPYQGQWWKRADLTVRFNNLLTFEEDVRTVRTVPVTFGFNGAGSKVTTVKSRVDIDTN